MEPSEEETRAPMLSSSGCAPVRPNMHGNSPKDNITANLDRPTAKFQSRKFEGRKVPNVMSSSIGLADFLHILLLSVKRKEILRTIAIKYYAMTWQRSKSANGKWVDKSIEKQTTSAVSLSTITDATLENSMGVFSMGRQLST